MGDRNIPAAEDLNGVIQWDRNIMNFSTLILYRRSLDTFYMKTTSFSPQSILSNLCANTKGEPEKMQLQIGCPKLHQPTENGVLVYNTESSFVWEHLLDVYCATVHIYPNFVQRKVNCGRTWQGTLNLLLSISNLGPFCKYFAARILKHEFCTKWFNVQYSLMSLWCIKFIMIIHKILQRLQKNTY